VIAVAMIGVAAFLRSTRAFGVVDHENTVSPGALLSGYAATFELAVYGGFS
jgi:hypothetical protein